MERRQVFISHAHKDNSICADLATDLGNRGFAVWIDLQNMQGGNQLDQTIQDQLKGREAFIVMLSRASVGSFWVQMETGAYLALMSSDLNRILIPVRIDDCEVPPPMRSMLYVDATQMSREKAIDAIVKALDGPARTPTIGGRLVPIGLVPRKTFLLGVAGALGLGVLATAAVALGTGPAGLRAWGVSPTPAPAKLPPTATPSPTPTPKPGDTLLAYMGHTGRVAAVAWSPDGTTLASAGADHSVQLWNPNTGKLQLAYTEHTAQVNAVAWSPDGKQLASASDDHTVKV